MYLADDGRIGLPSRTAPRPPDASSVGLDRPRAPPLPEGTHADERRLLAGSHPLQTRAVRAFEVSSRAMKAVACAQRTDREPLCHFCVSRHTSSPSVPAEMVDLFEIVESRESLRKAR